MCAGFQTKESAVMIRVYFLEDISDEVLVSLFPFYDGVDQDD